MKTAMGVIVLGIATISCLPLVFYDAVLVPGWYCIVGENVKVTDGTYSLTLTLPYGMTYVILNVVYLAVGITIMCACSLHIMVKLCSKGAASGCSIERKFAKLVGVIAAVFLLTYLPYMVQTIYKSH